MCVFPTYVVWVFPDTRPSKLEGVATLVMGGRTGGGIFCTALNSQYSKEAMVASACRRRSLVSGAIYLVLESVGADSSPEPAKSNTHFGLF